MYLKYLNNIEDAEKLPLTMELLARWQVEEAKTLFLNYLRLDDGRPFSLSDIRFTAIKVLYYYKDPSLIKVVEPYLMSNNDDMAQGAKKAIKRLKGL